MGSGRLKSPFIKRYGETIAVVLVFIAILVIGLTVFDDYGIPIDDPFERETTFINLKNVVTRFIPETDLPDEIVNHPDLNGWEDRMYGIATQIPTAVIEWLFEFTLSQRNVFLLRHLWTFIQFYFGLIAFYFLLQIRFKSGWLALLGSVSLWLSPRIFADSFYNIKDIVFLSWMMIAGLFLVRWFDRKRLFDLTLFSIFASIATNVRVFGGILVLYALFSVVILIRRGELEFWIGLRTCVWMMLIYGVFWVLWMPYAWDNPVRAAVEALLMTARSEVIDSVLYFGQHIPVQAVPWHYLPVWIAITTPTVIFLSFIAGFCLFAVSLFRRNGTESFRVLVDGLAFSILLLPIGMTIILRPPLYNAYRHLFFIYPWMIYFSILFLNHIKFSKRKIVRNFLFSFFLCSLLWNGIWIARNHPFEMIYFSEWFPRELRSDFDRDYWYIAGSDALTWVLNHDENLRIPIVTEKMMIENALILFPESEVNRLVLYGMKPDMSDVRYIMINYFDLTPENIEGYLFPSFEKTYELVIDGAPVYGIFQRITRFALTPELVQVISMDGSTDDLTELSDGDRGTEWSSGETEAVQLTLPEVVLIRGVTLFTAERMNGIPDEIKIMVSTDGVAYEPVSLTDANYAEFFFEPVEARYVRIESSAAVAKWRISEIQVWEAKE